MNLLDLGYTSELEQYRTTENLTDFEVGRVSSEHKERYTVKTPIAEYEAEIIGNLRYTAQERSDFPAVGDWVALSVYDDEKALIHKVFPRKTIIERQAVGTHHEKQIIATNIDYALIVQGVDRDFNLNRMERYLTICYAAGVEPILVLTKVDLTPANELAQLIHAVEERVNNLPLFAVSSTSQQGIDQLKTQLQKGKTYCLLGSSGVGKSTLTNLLSGKQLMETSSISQQTNKGRHTTSHRELMVLKDGGILIDNPGMREIGITDTTGGLEDTFETIIQLAEDCKFKDCTHTSEIGCAVLAALETGALDEAVYQNFLKMEREKQHYEASVAERRQKDKSFGKLYKAYKGFKNSNL